MSTLSEMDRRPRRATGMTMEDKAMTMSFLDRWMMNALLAAGWRMSSLHHDESGRLWLFDELGLTPLPRGTRSATVFALVAGDRCISTDPMPCRSVHDRPRLAVAS